MWTWIQFSKHTSADFYSFFVAVVVDHFVIAALSGVPAALIINWEIINSAIISASI